MQLVDTGPEPFFEDVVNHMAAICVTPIAMVVLERSCRTWINCPGKERGIEARDFPADLTSFVGPSKNVVTEFEFAAGEWPDAAAPRSFISVPLVLRGEFHGALVIADTRPRIWSSFEESYMVRSARLVASHFEARAVLVERDRALSELALYKKALDKFALVSVADERGVITHVNERFCAISGYQREDLIGVDHRIVNSGKHPKQFFVEMWRTIGRGDLWRGEICNRAKDGSYYWVDSTIVPIAEGEGRKSYTSIRIDCTERRLAQERLAEVLSALETERNSLEARVTERTLELQDAVRLAEAASAAKTNFLAIVTHELRTPLHQIIGYAEMINEDIEDGAPDSTQIQKDANTIITASHHLLQVINGILDFSKIEAGKMSMDLAPVELSPFLEECVASVRHSAEKNGNVILVDIRGNMRAIVTDRLRLKQCMINLLSNAAKFTSNGKITLAVETARTDTGAWMRVDVSDTGVGIPQEAQAHLFEPFYQVSSGMARSVEGTGLGLTVTRQIVRLLGGELSVKSAPGAGATFTMLIPMQRPHLGIHAA